MWAKARDFIVLHRLSCPRRRASSTPRQSRDPQALRSTGSPAFAGDDGKNCGVEACPSRHRKAQRLAAAAHVDGGKTDRGEAAGAAIALFVDLELALARAELFGAAPVQRLVPQLDDAVFAV